MTGTFFPYLVAFGWTSIFILLGVYLRNKVKFFQKLFIPTSIIAGVIGFICINLGLLQVPTETGWVELKPAAFGVIVFHLFALSFVAIGLLDNTRTSNSSEHVKLVFRGSFWISMLFILVYSLQSLLGFSVFSLWKDITGSGADEIIGYLFGTAFSQGPGQTMSYATIWENAPYYIVNAVNIGLTFSALGFFSATLVGVPLARYGIRKGWSTINKQSDLSNEFVTGLIEDRKQACAHPITHSANIDTFAYHLAMIFALYLVAYFFSIFWARVMPPSYCSSWHGLYLLMGSYHSKNHSCNMFKTQS